MHTVFMLLFINIFYRTQVDKSVTMTHLITVHHEVMCCDQGLEDHDPAGVGGPLKQRVCQLRDVDVHLIGTMYQIYKRNFH